MLRQRTMFLVRHNRAVGLLVRAAVTTARHLRSVLLPKRLPWAVRHLLFAIFHGVIRCIHPTLAYFPPTSPRSPEDSHMKQPLIVVADDHELIAEGIAGLLRANYHVAGLVADGRQLLAEVE